MQFFSDGGNAHKVCVTPKTLLWMRATFSEVKGKKSSFLMFSLLCFGRGLTPKVRATHPGVQHGAGRCSFFSDGLDVDICSFWVCWRPGARFSKDPVSYKCTMSVSRCLVNIAPDWIKISYINNGDICKKMLALLVPLLFSVNDPS